MSIAKQKVLTTSVPKQLMHAEGESESCGKETKVPFVRKPHLFFRASVTSVGEFFCDDLDFASVESHSFVNTVSTMIPLSVPHMAPSHACGHHWLGNTAHSPSSCSVSLLGSHSSQKNWLDKTVLDYEVSSSHYPRTGPSTV